MNQERFKLDIHITTCNRYDVKCRPRPRPHYAKKWNVKEWTNDERVEISKISVESIIKLKNQLESHGHIVRLTLIDDGTDIEQALEWHKSIDRGVVNIKKLPNRGSSVGINEHFQEIKQDPPDYILHVEDDNLFFNPLNIDWLKNIDNVKKQNDNIIVFTLRSGLPVEPCDHGYKGAWGPVKYEKIANFDIILFKCMGNAHHIMKWKDYCKFFPLSGNTGSCESYMNSKLLNLGYNCEIQQHVHFFHSHLLNYPIGSNHLNNWHKTGEGFEYGHKDMNLYLLKKNPVKSKIYNISNKDFEIIELVNYDY